ncbi:flagellar hook-basal body complex protein FliE [Chitinivorax tropicus]|uniref:Flagellar hook-basal body complex protein FliE n=1 Tax=Chitinivorax tropicus TaxID=714531 RepID=A0A840MNT8_9PROT|nr:flagellar hook-basal body complex protein FliE [Chitinivorax tropicus]MBB5020308.1 flagellar hook-basal body complex protein FliE [Chitinivorax tropicus]
MSAAFIAPINPVQIEPTALISASGTLASAHPQGFAAWFDGQVHQVNQQIAAADQGLQKLALGDASNLHHVMLQLEEAKLSVQLFVQIRNRMLEAYQDVMRMQM